MSRGDSANRGPVYDDERLRGPCIVDHVQYALSLGPVGQLAHAVNVCAKIGKIS